MYSDNFLEVFALILMVPSQVRTDGLPVPVALYPLDDKHGTSDIGPNKNPPGIPSDVHLAPGPNRHPKGSYQFSGSSTSYIEIPNNGGLETRYSITVLAWVNPETESGPIFVYGNEGFRFWINRGGVYANDQHWGAQPSSPRVSNSWYYVGVTYSYSSGIAKVWVNGKEKAQVSVGSQELETHYNVRMAAKDNGDARYFKGRICCVQVYNKALSKQEIIAVQSRTFSPETDDAHFLLVFPIQQERQDDILTTFTACTVMECLLRCSRMTECKSVAIEGINIDGSSEGYCQLYRAPFKESLGSYENHLKDKQYYNKNKLALKEIVLTFSH